MKIFLSLGVALLTLFFVNTGSASALDVNWTGGGDGRWFSDTDNWDLISGLTVSNRSVYIDQANYSVNDTLIQNMPGLDIESLQLTGTSGGSKTLDINGLAMTISGNGGNGAITARGDSQVYINNRIISDSGNINGFSLIANNNSRLVLNSPSIDLNGKTAYFMTKSTSVLSVDSVLLNTDRVVFTGAGPIYTKNNFSTDASKTIVNKGAKLYPRGEFGDNVYLYRDSWTTPQTCVDTGNLFVKAYSRVRFPVGGNSSCLEYSRLNVTGTVKLFANSKLSLLLSGFEQVPVGTELWLIRNDGREPIYGRFFGYPEGKQVTLGSTIYELSYRGGTGNDLTLTAIDLVEGK